MRSKNKLTILKVIAEISSKYPENNLILTYSDFLALRDFLSFYQFNPILFNRLVDLTLELWNTNRRINRISLINSILRYGYQLESSHTNKFGTWKPKFKDDAELTTKLFTLFQQSFEKNPRLSKPSKMAIQKGVNQLIYRLSFDNSMIEWLCQNAFSSELILNRVLRYPFKAQIISEWCKFNFNNEKLFHRRAEVCSWIIDLNPNFEVDEHTLLMDFDSINRSDQIRIETYIEEKAMFTMVEKELKEILPRKGLLQLLGIDAPNQSDYPRYTKVPNLQLSSRFYQYKMTKDERLPIMIPDYIQMEKDFKENINLMIDITMIWSICYSRLSQVEKSKLLTKYYRTEFDYIFLRVAKRYKLLNLLHWMKRNS